MGKRIAVLAPFSMDPDFEQLREIIKNIAIRNTEKVKEEDTELDFYLLNKGFTDAGSFWYLVFNVRNNNELFEAALDLRDQGYDALVIHCAADSHLDPLRQACDFPVVGVMQAGLLLATMMGSRIGLVTFSDLVIPYFENLVAAYGLRDKITRVRSTNSTGMELISSLVDTHDIIERFSSVARECIADGADVLVPG
ncbi:MAG: hypothetical protein JW854_15550 [Actinobacteria bacterium]|nr:hypothetical protein [Actinomycetota bacterium]